MDPNADQLENNAPILNRPVLPRQWKPPSMSNPGFRAAIPSQRMSLRSKDTDRTTVDPEPSSDGPSTPQPSMPAVERPVIRSPLPRAVDSPTPAGPRYKNSTRPNAPYQRPSLAVANPSSLYNTAELKMLVKNLPPDWTTWEIYEFLQKHGTIHRIEIREPRRMDQTFAWVIFVPPPAKIDFFRGDIRLTANGVTRQVQFEACVNRPARPRPGSSNARQGLPDRIRLPSACLQVGVMKSADTMLVCHTTLASPLAPVELELNLLRKVLDIDFAMTLQCQTGSSAQKLTKCQYKIRLNLPQLRTIFQGRDAATQRISWVLSMTQPPFVFRKTDNIKATHDPETVYWNEWQAWFRQTEIGMNPNSTRGNVVQLQNEDAVVDIGRCLTYRVVFDEATVDTPAFVQLTQALRDHSILIHTEHIINCDFTKSEVLWSWLENPVAAAQQKAGMSTLSDLHDMAFQTIYRLPSEVRYELEVCISHGVLHECNIIKEFLAKLATEDPATCCRALEKAASTGDRIFDPDDIFRRYRSKLRHGDKPVAWDCMNIRSAAITPTTVYFMTPMMEQSNRVVRKYSAHSERFLRVKFTDENGNGKSRIMASEDATMNQVYTRIKRALMNGISVGGMHYEFLAFGNSQFREHGAWFFASTGDLTAERIRNSLGDFSSIKVIAKYASRIGQCFSTTKSKNWFVDEEVIPDIERNGFCFTDGVGKISPFVAKMIAQQLNFASATESCPSAFQFRHRGCKGILVVDPMLKRNIIQTRPSQNKFPTEHQHGLEIVRVSTFSTSYLNVQLILVLSALGVPDDVFTTKMRTMLQDLEEAMHSEQKAVHLLAKYIDFNQMTLQLVRMILDRFMAVQEPFLISCLHLWRSWSLKYLQEKARIFVDEGAFVLGCVDETGTLRGHFDGDVASSDASQDINTLPQIFLQIDQEGNGRCKIMKGVCTLMRNPSTHPGDVRVVLAVDVPTLHHIRNCVVLPSTGNRDLANMCSGGDLDGDDYLVIWDKELLPKEWNHPPMDYTAPPAKMSEGKITIDDITSFYVTHMKHDNLGRIAVAHKYTADAQAEGVKSEPNLELANLHSMAVDFAKTGVPAVMPKRLKVRLRPHWSGLKEKVYTSHKVIGKLYDLAQRVQFQPAWHLPFDQRLLSAYNLDEEILQSAYEAKEDYDESVRQIMAKYSIRSEFEVWTTFVLEHSDDVRDYKFAETIGEATGALKEAHRKACYEKAGTTEKERDWSKMGPFVAAMYTATAREMAKANEECDTLVMKGGEWVHAKTASFDNMPLMSFPWLFPEHLGKIASDNQNSKRADVGRSLVTTLDQNTSTPPMLGEKPTAPDENDDQHEASAQLKTLHKSNPLSNVSLMEELLSPPILSSSTEAVSLTGISDLQPGNGTEYSSESEHVQGSSYTASARAESSGMEDDLIEL